MIEIHITQTGKGYGRDDQYRIFNEETKTVADMAEAKAYLKERYGNCKRSYMYQDTKSGETKRVGYIYHFREQDWSHPGKGDKWLEQDWVSFHKLTRITV